LNSTIKSRMNRRRGNVNPKPDARERAFPLDPLGKAE
jgi:hypothetical protein